MDEFYSLVGAIILVAYLTAVTALVKIDTRLSDIRYELSEIKRKLGE